MPVAKRLVPIAITTPTPKRLMRGSASSSAVGRTRNGLGAIVSPVCSADQCQTFWSQSTSESRKPPNATWNSVATTDAPVKERRLNRPGSTSGFL